MIPQSELKVASYQGSQSSQSPTNSILQFLNKELRSQTDFLLQDEYPSLFQSLPGGESLIIEREEQILSHVGIIKRRYTHPGFQMDIGLIGSVVTRSEHRGEGLASSLLQEALKRLKQKGCSLALLWSDQPDFYTPLGFYRAGNEWDFRISIEKSRNASEVCRPLNREKDVEAIWKLYQTKAAKFERSLQEMSALVRVPRTQVYVTEKGNQITSYLAINKGADFTNYIHEWAGPVDEVKKNIQDCQKRFFPQTPLTVIAPLEKESSHLLEISDCSWKGALGLVNVLDRAQLIKCFNSFFNHQALTLPDLDLSQLSDEECLMVILGKDGLFEGNLLPLFLWGFDSI